MNHSTDTVTISSQGRELVREDHLAPVRNKIIALEAENGGLRESLEHHVAETRRQGFALKAQSDALMASHNRDRELADFLAEIINAAHKKNAGSVIGLASAALRVLA